DALDRRVDLEEEPAVTRPGVVGKRAGAEADGPDALAVGPALEPAAADDADRAGLVVVGQRLAAAVGIGFAQVHLPVDRIAVEERAELAALDVADLDDAEEVPLPVQRSIARAERPREEQRRDTKPEAPRAIDERVNQDAWQPEAEPRAQRALAEVQVFRQ